jgi:hypothetical protein
MWPKIIDLMSRPVLSGIIIFEYHSGIYYEDFTILILVVYR